MRKPYKVAVWGPGGLGGCAIRELNRLPEIELVAVLAYSPEKNGVDAGSLVGTGPIGIKATTDVSTFLAAKPECVIYTARDYGDCRADNDIVMLLESGINVITPLPYQYPKSRGNEVEQRLNDAARRGGVTLFGTGVNPGFFAERLALVMTGISNDIQSVCLHEFVNCEHMKDPVQILTLFGFGSSQEDLAKNPIAAILAENILIHGIYYLGDKLGMPIDRIERKSHHVVSKVDMKNPGLVDVAKGNVCVVSYEWVGYCGDKAFISIWPRWYINESVRPELAKGDDYWLLEIEGQPSSRVGVEIQGSFKNNLILLPNNPTPGAWFATVITMIQAIPHVIEAEPGIMLPDASRMHWKPDMRQQIALD